MSDNPTAQGRGFDERVVKRCCISKSVYSSLCCFSLAFLAFKVGVLLSRVI